MELWPSVRARCARRGPSLSDVRSSVGPASRDFGADTGGQAIQIGAVLLFAVLIVFFSTYQAFVVPDQNAQVEFNHNQKVQQQMEGLRNAIVTSPGETSTVSVSLELGTQYPARVLALNPSPSTGSVRTAGTTDLVGDSAWDVPFVPNGGGSLDVVEDDGSTTTFDANGQDSQPVGVGDWDGDGGDEVVYARGGQLYEVESGTTPDRFLYGCGGRVPNSCSKVSTDGVAGVANVDGDSTTDIVFTDNGDLEYLTGSSTQQNTDPTTTIATGISGSAVSHPADFDDDGTVEIAVEDGGDVTFYNSGGTDDLGTITTSSQVAQAPMAASDWSADEVPDVVYVDSGGDVHYLDATSGTTGLVTKDDGTTVSADSNQGLR